MRVIDASGTQLGILDIARANAMARDAGLDLVEIVPNSDPPVCKIIDFGKFKYELGKKEKLVKKKQHTIQIKEIRLSPKIEEHDFNFKMKHLRTFIEQGHKVKITVIFKGRQIAHREFGEQLIQRIVQLLEDIARIESGPNFEGRNMIITFIKK